MLKFTPRAIDRQFRQAEAMTDWKGLSALCTVKIHQEVHVLSFMPDINGFQRDYIYPVTSQSCTCHGLQ